MKTMKAMKKAMAAPAAMKTMKAMKRVKTWPAFKGATRLKKLPKPKAEPKAANDQAALQSIQWASRTQMIKHQALYRL